MADPTRVRALTFDCYGTLIDWEAGIRAYLRGLLARKSTTRVDPERFFQHWYFQCELPTIAGPFQLYHQVLQQSVQQALRDFDLPLEPADGADFGASMQTWPPFPDTHAVLTRLAARFPLCIVSNTTREIIAASVRLMDVRFAEIVTAQDVGAYKPDERPFRRALERLCLEPGQVLHVFQSQVVDLPTAKPLGFQTAWINRQSETLAPDRPDPDWIFADLAPVAALLGA